MKERICTRMNVISNNWIRSTFDVMSNFGFEPQRVEETSLIKCRKNICVCSCYNFSSNDFP